MVPNSIELKRKFTVSPPKALDSFDGLRKLSRFYLMRWGGEADIKLLVTKFIRFVILISRIYISFQIQQKSKIFA